MKKGIQLLWHSINFSEVTAIAVKLNNKCRERERNKDSFKLGLACLTPFNYYFTTQRKLQFIYLGQLLLSETEIWRGNLW